MVEYHHGVLELWLVGAFYLVLDRWRVVFKEFVLHMVIFDVCARGQGLEYAVVPRELDVVCLHHLLVVLGVGGYRHVLNEDTAVWVVDIHSYTYELVLSVGLGSTSFSVNLAMPRWYCVNCEQLR